MNDETRRMTHEMDQYARRAYERIRPHLSAGGEMSAGDFKTMMAIMKYCADVMRDVVEINKDSDKYSTKKL